MAGLLRELLDDPTRDRCPGQRPVVSVHPDDEPAYLAELARTARRELELERRGSWHGRWAELDPERLAHPGYPPPRAPAEGAYEREHAARWHDARPIVLPGALGPELLELLAPRLDEALADHALLAEPGGLRALLEQAEEALAPDFTPLARKAPLDDPERDLERVRIAALAPGTRRGRAELWAKSAWLSTFEDDRSLRLRLSFGREGRDDATRDLARHRAVGELAARLFPECLALEAAPELLERVERLEGEPLLLTQQIAYWNAPQGGARFHHDAFDEDPLGRQLGVLYVQLVGRTAWLALSSDDLAARVRELVGWIEAGELGWVRAQLESLPGGWRRIRELTLDERALALELSLPGCGALGPLVDRGPEFTSALADAGHAYVLEPGDVMLLPNQGLGRTAMHSVFCASDELTYALSSALRSDRRPAALVEEARRARAERRLRRLEEAQERRLRRGRSRAARRTDRDAGR